VALGATSRTGAERQAFVRAWHTQALEAVDRGWAAELTAVGAPVVPPPPPVQGPANGFPSARDAAPAAISKAGPEVPVVRALQGDPLALPTPVTTAAWSALVARRAADAHLDDHSRALMRRKIASEVDPSGTQLVPLDDATFARRVTAFERLLAEDTLRNEVTMHRALHQWMSVSSPDLEALNRDVYAQLFLTPRRDPWLGLLSEDGYAAIENDGLVMRGGRGR
jgi:hypothetical protein